VAYWHFAFLGQESVDAAMASECAGDQDRFWEFHELLFNSQNGENQGAFTNENLKAFAVKLGLNADTFNQCLDSGKYLERVQTQTQAAQQLGVRSTPTFAINGQGLVGAQPFDAFQKVIEDKLLGAK
jgi:protein-disulfide isomerase